MFARGLCAACYSRLYRRGTTDRKYGRQGETCSEEGCDKKPQARGLCSLHYLRSRHPLISVWKNIRSKYPEEYPPEWDGDFAKFLDDVGERPGEKFQLRRVDGSQPWASGNWEWRPPIIIDGKTGVTANMAEYHLRWKYKRRFKLDDADIQQMLIDQNETCPVCAKPLLMENPKTGAPIKVVLDHDHHTGAPREFAHDNCNKGMGQLSDDPGNCQRAADYLRKHNARST